jgi:protein-disulfide isomerase
MALLASRLFMVVGRKRELGRWRSSAVAMASGALLWASGCSALLNAPRAATGVSAAGPVPIEPDEALFGLPTAPVTAVVFLDYMDAESRVTLRALEQLRSKDPGTFRYVIRHFPTCRHELARASATAASAVLELGGAGAFWTFTQELIEYQSRASPEFLRAAARRAGLSEPQLDLLDDARFDERVTRDLALARTLTVEDSPTLFLNGIRLDGFISRGELEAKLAQELPRARAVRARVQRDMQAYQLRVEENARGWTEPEPPEAPDPRIFPDQQIYAVPVGDSPSDGPADAPVTIVQFANFNSACSRAVQPELERMRAKYGEQLRVVFKHLAWWASSKRPANFVQQARVAGGDAKFFEAEKLLWQGERYPSDAALEGMAVQLGLDPEDTLRAVHDDRHGARIDDDLALSYELNVHWEPSLFVNGRFLSDEQIDRLEPMIEERLQAARSLLAAGTPPARLYEAVVASAPAPAQVAPKPPLVPPSELPFRGEPDAPIVVQIFGSYRSIACLTPDAIERLRLEHPRQIKLVFWPLPEPVKEPKIDAQWQAAEAALEAHAQLGNVGFWHMAKGMCRSFTPVTLEDLESYADQISLNVERFREALADHRHVPRIEAALAAAKELGIEHARAFVVNGELIGGYRGIEFRTARRIEALLRSQPKEPAPTP